MDQLIETSSMSFSVSSVPNNPTPRPRISQYKSRSNGANQEERRRRILEEQKQKRSESFNASRGLLEELGAFIEDEDKMEWTAAKAKSRYREVYKDRLMFSEWLVNVPEDLAQLWYLVPCPEGQRTLVVASHGSTKAYLKSGYLRASFQSALPGGSRHETKAYTILDCIWCLANHSYYILDVLAWSNQPMLDCETEFRFYWLKSKLQELSHISEHATDNLYPFLPLPYYPCDISVMTNIMAMEHLFGQTGPGLDGLLFYHSEAHYVPGSTPLVGWLKPNMMPQLLGVPVALAYQQEQMETNKKPKRFRKQKQKRGEGDGPHEMETTALEETDDSVVEEMEPQESSPNKSEGEA